MSDGVDFARLLPFLGGLFNSFEETVLITP